MSNVLLIGNGILRAYGGNSCDDLIKNLKKKHTISYSDEILNKLPFSQKVVVASRDNVDEFSKNELVNFTDISISKEQSKFYREIVGLNLDAILSTNYSFELEQAVFDQWNRSVHWEKRHYIKKKVSLREKHFGLYEYIELKDKKLFHIHGNAHAPNSIIIGHYYYGKLLGQIQEYIPRFLRRYNAVKNKEGVYSPQNWVEYFLLSDVYIMGFGLDIAETDLWWLICCKKRHFKDTKIVFYEPQNDTCEEKRLLLETYNVSIKHLCQKCDKDKYGEYYQSVINDIKKMIE